MRDILPNVVWFLSGERISWFVCFPLQLYFAYQGRWWAVAILAAVSMVVVTYRATIGNIRTSVLMRSRERRQIALNRKAEDCLQSLQTADRSKRRPFVLFLRSFSTDTILRAKMPTSPDGYDSMPLETRLAAGFDRRFTTVSLSSSRIDHGAWGEAFASMPLDLTVNDPLFNYWSARLFYTRPGEIILPENDWKGTFRLLAHQADLIISVPIDPSTAPEPSATFAELLELLVDNLLQRCVFVMPPEQKEWFLTPNNESDSSLGTGRTWSKREMAVSELWESMRKKLEKVGIELPVFKDTPGGATLFTLRCSECQLVSVSSRNLLIPRRYLKALGLSIPLKS